MQDLAENMGLQSLNDRLQDPDCAMWFYGIFPRDTPRNMRFSINFFTSIGLGGLTDNMRAYLKVDAQLCCLLLPCNGENKTSYSAESKYSDKAGMSRSLFR